MSNILIWTFFPTLSSYHCPLGARWKHDDTCTLWYSTIYIKQILSNFKCCAWQVRWKRLGNVFILFNLLWDISVEKVPIGKGSFENFHFLKFKLIWLFKALKKHWLTFQNCKNKCWTISWRLSSVF